MKMTKTKLRGALKSRTMGFIVLSQDIVGVLLVSSEFLQTQLSPAAFGWYLIAIGIVAKILRWHTGKALENR